MSLRTTTSRIHATQSRSLAAAAAIALSLSAMTATAQAADAGDPIEAATDAYLAAYPGLSDAEARSAALGSTARRAVYDGAALDAATFGGAWFDPRSGGVHVAGTTAAANENASALGRRYGIAVTTHRVSRSAATLERHGAALRAGQGEIGAAARGQVGIDVRTNQVVAAVPGSRRAELAGKAGAAVTVIDDTQIPVQEDASCTSRLACDSSIRAGAIIWAGATTSPTCSVGFTARDASNQRYVYTAGHCSTGNGVRWGTGPTGIGTMIKSTNTGAIDVGVIQVTGWTFPLQAGGEIYNQETTSKMYSLNAVAPSLGYIVAGETVCLSANYTVPNGATWCGVVGTNSDAEHRGMVRVDGVDACSGDSGGGWYWLRTSTNRVAYGIHSGSDPGCHGDAGGRRSWFSAVPTVKKSYTPDLTIETRAP